MTITADEARRLLDYAPDTGAFNWRVKGKGRKPGKQAGSVMLIGYRTICIRKRGYYAHRLAWLIVTGKWPSGEIDHIDRDKLNNAWGNLRECSRAENCRNAPGKPSRTNGLRGVVRASRNGKFEARIRLGGNRPKHIGTYDTRELAHEAYARAAKQHHGEFASLD